MPPAAPSRPAPSEPFLRTTTRTLGVLVLVGAPVLALLHPLGVRIVWSLVIAALPMGLLLAGYHAWRRVCPLAFFATLGQRLKRQGKRKAGDWLGAHHLDVQTALLASAMVLRHLGANDSPWVLTGLFAAVILAALATGFLFTGKTWCNHLCPVGLIEKLYLEPTQLRPAAANSQCATCTACKKNCPDIDLEQAYWKEADLPARRRAYGLWPGLVLGYFVYPWLATGAWAAYGSAAWAPAGSAPALLSPGFFFAPWFPRVTAVPATMAAFGSLSWLAAFVLERRLAHAGMAPGSARHRVMAAAGFTAFLLFYAFAGRAVLGLLPGWMADTLAVAGVAAATAVLLGRWNRTEEDFVHEKFARGLLKRWEWGEQPTTNRLSELYLLHQERIQEREARLVAYKATLRDLLAEGVLTAGNLRMLQRMRAELGISDKEQAKLVGELDLEDARLLDPEFQGSMEKQLQLEQYRKELEALLLDGGGAPALPLLDSLRRAHRVSEGEHAAALAAIRGETGALRARLKVPVTALVDLRQALQATEDLEAGWTASGALTPARSRRLSFFRHATHACRRQHLGQVLRLLDLLPGASELGPLHRMQETAPPDGLQELETLLGAMADPEAAGQDLAPLRDAPVRGADPWAALDRALADPSPYLRAAALSLVTDQPGPVREPLVRAALVDPSPLVRDTAQALLGAPSDLAELAGTLDPEDEETWLLRVAVQALPEAARLNRAGQSTLRLPAQAPRKGITVQARLASLERLMFLHGVPLFSTLAPEDLDLLSGSARERRWQRDETLCLQGEWSEEVFLILRGTVRAWRLDEGGRPRVLADSGPGTCLGEMAALEGGPRTASLTALEPVEALTLDGKTFRTLLHERPEVADGLLRVISRRLRSVLSGTDQASNGSRSIIDSTSHRV